MWMALAMAKTTSGNPGWSRIRDRMVGWRPQWRRNSSAWGSNKWVTAKDMSTHPNAWRKGSVVFCLIRLRIRVSAEWLWLEQMSGDDVATLWRYTWMP